MRGTPLGWTYCPTCARAVLVVTARDNSAQYVGTHWMQPNRRCPASQIQIPSEHRVAKTRKELEHG